MYDAHAYIEYYVRPLMLSIWSLMYQGKKCMPGIFVYMAHTQQQNCQPHQGCSLRYVSANAANCISDEASIPQLPLKTTSQSLRLPDTLEPEPWLRSTEYLQSVAHRFLL